MNGQSLIALLLLLGLGEEVVHAEDGLLVHLELHWGCANCFVFGAAVGCLGVNCAAVGKERLVVEVVLLAVGVSCFEACCVVEETLIVHEILVGGLSLAESNLLTDVSFLLLDLLLALVAHLFHPLLTLDLSHPVVPELFPFLKFLVLILLLIVVLLNLLELIPRLKCCPPQFLLLLEVLLVIHAPLYLCSLLKLDLGLPLCHIQRIDDISELLIDGVVLQRSSVGCESHVDGDRVTS